MAVLAVAIAMRVVIELRTAPRIDHFIRRVVIELDHLAALDPALQQGSRCRRGIGKCGHAVARSAHGFGELRVWCMTPMALQSL